MEEKKPNRIWIELRHPAKDFPPGPERTAAGFERARLCSDIFIKLGVDKFHKVWWNDREQVFCFTTDSAGSYVEASDNGHWFNLDYLAR